MAGEIVLTIKETNLLRKRFQQLIDLREELLNHPDKKTVHDLRVASRRAREALAYFEESLPAVWQQRLRRPAKEITGRLGDLREAEVNLMLAQKLSGEQSIPPLAGEMLLHILSERLRRLMQKVRRRTKSSKLGPYSKFLARLRGSRTCVPAVQEVIRRRADEFYGFTLPQEMNDEQLHQLRILTKKFRYALEIDNRLRTLKIGRFILRVRRLQELLGTIHDLFVFAEVIRAEIEKWKQPGLDLIPEALNEALRIVVERKTALYSRVPVLHSRVIDNSPESVPSTPKKVVQSVTETTIENSPGSISA